MSTQVDARCQIEKDVPLPPVSRRGGGGRSSIYPFAEMQTGDSFPVPFGDEDPKKVIRRVRTAILVFRRSHKDYKFRTRQDSTHIRVWRDPE